MNARVGVRELRQQASALLRRVQAGESLDITDRGRPVARLVPIRTTRVEQLSAEGRLTEPTEDFLAVLEEVAIEGPFDAGASQALAELRAGER